MLAITFTEAAAAELRDRVREQLERQRCARAVEEIDQASISTIHAFAGQLLRTFPLEAGLPEYAEREPDGYVAEEPADADCEAAIEAERQWLDQRRERIEQCARIGTRCAAASISPGPAR